ncbi:MAG: molybdopterin molybdotransferase MoeA [Actinomycetia bacterium]|nr:molybdopterin molybdotransferase MoeA [Actinomycetes bacterium]
MNRPSAPLWNQARQLAYDTSGNQQQVEHLPLTAAVDGRTLAESVVAESDLPPAATSAMDGWAVCGTGPWLIVGSALAGQPSPDSLEPQRAIRIATGAQTPPQTTAVVRSEAGVVQQHAGQDWLESDWPDPAFIRPAAAECCAGTELASRGMVLNPALIGLLAATGVDQVAVRKPPRVAVVIFGDELLTEGPPRAGRVRDSLGPQLGAWIARLGGVAQPPQFVPDVASEHVSAIAAALETTDLVITTGGTASGPVDHLHTAVSELGGEFVVDSAAIRPGHPMLLARLPVPQSRTPGTTRLLLGLPGNPQSALIALMALGQPVIHRLLDRELPQPAIVMAAAEITAPPAENRVVPGNLAGRTFTATEYLGSAMLRGVASATGLGVVKPGGVVAGEELQFLALP